MLHPPIVLTIAGSDCSGGAGIQADLKTIAAHNCYSTSVITSLTAQNTWGVTEIQTPSITFLEAQLRAVLDDFAPQAVKIGMLPEESVICAVAMALQIVAAPIVLDPVMVATSGAALSSSSAVNSMQELLFPMATLLTPNIPEAEQLADMKIRNEDDMLAAAKKISVPVLLKGGHLRCGSSAVPQTPQSCDDLLWVNGQAHWLKGEYVACGETHGTGCTLSSAVACNLALGYDLLESCRRAKAWLTLLLKEKPNFGVPNGPLFHRSAV